MRSILVLFLYTFANSIAQHNPGENCFVCHSEFAVAGTVFQDSTAETTAAGIPLRLLRSDGSEIVLDRSNSDGNIFASVAADGEYIVELNNFTSRTWHSLPEQGNCNSCHLIWGNSSEVRKKKFNKFHTQIPPGNDCTHCHHFPASMSYEQLMSNGVLNISPERPDPETSFVFILGESYPFDPLDYDTIITTRPDIFAPGFFSMFDVILTAAADNGINIDYHFDEDRQTHFIDAVNGISGDYWYHFSYDAGHESQVEIQYRRANRWDELLWRDGAWVSLSQGGNLEELKEVFYNEIQRERQYGHQIGSLLIRLNPSDYKGNPEGSGRVTFTKEYENIIVTPHSMRGAGYPSLYSKPFQPGVTTSMDILLSLVDQGELTVVTGVFYSYFAGNFIDSYYVVEMGFPGVGTAHASGRNGFVYVTENGSYGGIPNNADRKLHVTSDIHVIHAPDFSYWRWIELGNPYYEDDEPVTSIDPMIAEDFRSVDRGFNLHPPYPNPFNGELKITFNIFEPGYAEIKVFNILGEHVETLLARDIRNIGVQTLSWEPGSMPAGNYFVVMTSGRSQQTRNISYIK